MRLIKDEFFRFFAFGFAGGAVLMFASLDLGSDVAAPAVVPVAHAAALHPAAGQ